MTDQVTLNLSMSPDTLQSLSIYDMDSQSFLQGDSLDQQVIYLQGLQYSPQQITLKQPLTFMEKLMQNKRERQQREALYKAGQ